MKKITVKIEGMACGMCEAHINEAVRNALSVKKVKSSYKKGETVILMEGDFDEEKLREAVTSTGYKVVSIEREPYKKKGLFSR